MMPTMKQPGAALLALAFVVGCGGNKPAERPAQPTNEKTVVVPEAQKRYPALRWVPANATYAAVAGATADVVTAGREVVNALGMMWGFDADEIDGELRRDLGASVLSSNDLSEMGIALDASAAVFSHQIHPTLLLPVADAAKIDAFIVDRRPSNASVTQRGGSTVMAWRPSDELEVHWARVDDYLAIHFTYPSDSPDLTWLDAMEAVPDGEGLAAHADFADAEQVARRISPDKNPSIVGLVRIGGLASAFGGLLNARDAGCLERMTSATEGRFLFGFDVHYDRSTGIGSLKLAPDFAGALAANTAASAPPGFYTYRDSVGAYGSVGVDPQWIDQLQRVSGCWLTGDALVGPYGLPPNGPRGINVAIETLDVDSLDGRLAAHMALRDRWFVQQYLDQIPKRSWFEKTVNIGGQNVTRLAVPMFPKGYYQLTDSQVVGAVGDGIMEVVFGGGNVPNGAELLALGVVPGRLPNLPDLIRSVAMVTPLVHPSVAQSLTARIERYEFAKLHLVLDGDEVVATASMKLRPM